MAVKARHIIGGLLLILLASGVVYISFEDKVRLRVDNDKSVFYVNESRWLISGLQEDRLFFGAKIIDRVKSTIERKNYTEGNFWVEYRYTGYENGESVVHTWRFDPYTSNIENFPVEEKICVSNAKGKYYRYSLKRLVDPGERRKLLNGETELSFGRNMKVKFAPGYSWAWVGWPYGKNSFAVQYKIKSDYECFDIRLFDPPVISSIFVNSTYGGNHTEENLTVYWTFETDNATKNITVWKINDNPLAEGYWPFVNSSGYQNGDYSGNNNNLTFNTGVWNETGGYDGAGGFEFEQFPSQKSAYLTDTTVLNPETGNFSMTWWARPLPNALANGMIGRYPPAVGYGGWDFSINTAGKVDFLIRANTSDGSFSRISNVGDVLYNKWHHFAAVRDDAKLIVYIDGVEVGNDTGLGTGKNISSNALFGIGARGASTGFNGSVDDVRYFDRYLTPSQVKMLYENKTDEICNSMTQRGENWSVCVTPNDGLEDGTTTCSEGLNISNCGHFENPQSDNWNIWLEDNCVLDQDYNATGYNLSIQDTIGNLYFNATYWFDGLLGVSSGVTTWMRDEARVWWGCQDGTC